MTCNPCGHCIHLLEFDDMDTGIMYIDCKVDGEFMHYDEKPCPSFKPMFASDGLIEEMDE